VKGIILAGGTGSRLWPASLVTNKHLLALYDKPVIYYPLTTLFAAGVREVTIVTSPEHRDAFSHLLGDGEYFGAEITYAVQKEPRGLVDALRPALIGLAGTDVAVILGDNFFHGIGLGRQLASLHPQDHRARIFAYRVSNPTSYGVVTLDSTGLPTDIQEKPSKAESPYAVTGMYFYPPDVLDMMEDVRASPRGEFEISTLNNLYLTQGRLDVTVLSRGTTWLDTGTPSDLQRAGEFVRIIEERQGVKLGCPEEVAWLNGWLSEDAFIASAGRNGDSQYSVYLANLLREGGLT